ncbi:hypothetical protein M436DRAFT_58958, partial [Aureobasidium namibiae CBS 147.97]
IGGSLKVPHIDRTFLNALQEFLIAYEEVNWRGDIELYDAQDTDEHSIVLEIGTSSKIIGDVSHHCASRGQPFEENP